MNLNALTEQLVEINLLRRLLARQDAILSRRWRHLYRQWLSHKPAKRRSKGI
jgi:hypothetical protein